MFDAMGDVIAQNFLFDAAKGCAHGGYLSNDIDAVSPLLDHLGEAADLTFDAAEAFEAGGFCLFLHALTYTPLGYICQ